MNGLALRSVLPTTTKVIGFRGREEISTPYAFDVGVQVPHEADVDPASLIGTRATISVLRELNNAPLPPYMFHGLISSAEVIDELDDRTEMVLRVVPQLWDLTLTMHSRIFTDVTIPEIIEATLKFSGVNNYRLSLTETYAKLEHVCQYREDNLSFISRLMEREGIYYYFEHGEEEELLVITDHRSIHQKSPASPVRFYASEEDASADEALFRFRHRVVALPSRVGLKDYNYVKPSLDVRGEAPIESTGHGDIILYGENFQTPDQGVRYATLRAEAYRARKHVFQGTGRVMLLRSGMLFDMEEHPRSSMNAKYLVTGLEHRAVLVGTSSMLGEALGLTGKIGYTVDVEAIEESTQYRPARQTAWPRIDGVMDGVIDGPAGGPYAEVDEHGRYKVRLFFDESDLVDGSASTWIRMLQPHGGGTEGLHFPLRKETEVHVLFLGGDPDRPIIVGVAPNSHKPSKVTAANHTQNVIMTGGSNRLELEDSAGGQYVTISSPTQTSFVHIGAGAHNYVASTDGNHKAYTGGNQDLQVIGEKCEDVTGAITETYLSSRTTSVTGAVQATFQATYDLTVWSAVTNTYDSTLDLTVAAAVTESFDATWDITVSGAVTQTYNTSLTQTVAGPVTEDHQGDKSTTITGTHAVAATGAQTIHSDASQEMTAPTQTFSADGQQSLTSTSTHINASSDFAVTAPTSSITSDNATVTGSATVTVDGAEITINGGNVTVQGGNLTIAHGPITVNGSPISVDGGGMISMGAGVIKLN